jgi:hypothetical protein
MKEAIKKSNGIHTIGEKRGGGEMNGTVLEGRTGKYKEKWKESNIVEAGKYDGST